MMTNPTIGTVSISMELRPSAETASRGMPITVERPGQLYHEVDPTIARAAARAALDRVYAQIIDTMNLPEAAPDSPVHLVV